MKPWHVWVYFAVLFAVAVYMRATGWEFPLWARVVMGCAVLAGQVHFLRLSLRTRSRHG